MKKLLAIGLILVMLLSLAACGGAEDPNVGVYKAYSCEVSGEAQNCEGQWLELKGNGKGTLYRNGQEQSCKWELEADAITVSLQGETFRGVLDGGMVKLDIGDAHYVYLMDPVQMEDGSAKGHVHNWKDADCVTGKTCAACGAEEGQPLGHTSTEANYQDPAVCTACGEITGQTLVPDMVKYGLDTFMELGVPYEYTTITLRNAEVLATGTITVTEYDIFTSAEGYPEKEGYEWRVIKGEVSFSHDNARKFGFSVGYCYEDYYNIELSDDSYVYDEETELSMRNISYHGQIMPYYFTEEWISGNWTYIAETKTKECTSRFVRAYQVPVGYDGIIAGFYNKQIDWEDRHIYELYDPEQFLFFRLA